MAPPPGDREARPVLSPGDLLAARYRLVRPVPSACRPDSPAVLWLAHDDVLARPVAAKVLPAGGEVGAAAGEAFLEAAAASGSLSHPVLARVYDAALEERPAERDGRAAGGVDVAYVISEWVDGPGLVQSLTDDGPYDAVPAVELAEALADALATAHARGLVHGRLHPGNVLLTSGGAVKLTDLGTSTVLPQRAVPALRAGDPAPRAADVRDLAAVLYAALTARWPATATPQPSGGLPLAPSGHEPGRSRGRLTSPRQVRAGVPRALDAVVVRALDPARALDTPALTTATGLSTALAGAVQADPARAPLGEPRPPRLSPRARRLLPAAVVVGLLTALGVAAYSFGVSIGTVDTPQDRLARLASPSPGAPAPAAAVRVPLADATVTDFDPPPGDGRERPGELGNAYDDDPSTAWRTERYEAAGFSGLKSGVGLLVDLGGPTPVSRVEVALEDDGTAVELRAGDARADSAAGFAQVASGTSRDGALVLTPPAGTRARYYLLWITGLPRTEDRFVAGVQELRLLRP